MYKRFLVTILVLFLFISCSRDKEILESLSDYNLSMQSKGYHFGDSILFPQLVMDNSESITISFGDQQTKELTISPKYYSLGDNAVNIIIRTKNGKELMQDATIKVFSKKEEQNIAYELVQTYPHNIKNFVQGFQIEGNIVYQSNGQQGESNIMKYILGSANPSVINRNSPDHFAEGCTIVGDKIYQLTWMHRKGFIYDKSTLNLVGEFSYPERIKEGWGITYDGKHLLVSDGSQNIYFLETKAPENILRQISIAGNTEVYDKINELEYHEGFIYANVWQKPYIIKIDPKTGEVIAKIDFTEYYDKHVTGEDDVLNGISFRDGNMFITGKNWDKIYEVKLKHLTHE